jgi:hypothetical protein
VKHLLLVLFIAASASGQILSPILMGNRAGGPVTLVQAVQGAYQGGAEATYTIAFTNNTAGDLGVVAMQWCGPSGTITGVADVSGNTYIVSAGSLASEDLGGGGFCYSQFAYVQSLKPFTGSNTVTISFSSGANGSAGLFELTPGAFDQTVPGTNDNTNTPAAGPITTTVNGCFYIMAGVLVGDGLPSGWFTAGSGFTLTTEDGGGDVDTADEYMAQATAGAATGTFTSSFAGFTAPNAGSLITFRPNPGG